MKTLSTLACSNVLAPALAIFMAATSGCTTATTETSLDAGLSDVSSDTDGNQLADDASIDVDDGRIVIDALPDVGAAEEAQDDARPCSSDGGIYREDVWAPDASNVRTQECTAAMPCPAGLLCAGIGCDDIWQCFVHYSPSEHVCPTDYSAYCGCDGVTFMAIRTCPDRPYQRVGACEDSVDCDPTKLRCSGAEPRCPVGYLPSVVDGQYGPCVPYDECACEFVWECPHRENYACNTVAKRCGLASPPPLTQ